jgi:hypothetical protein
LNKWCNSSTSISISHLIVHLKLITHQDSQNNSSSVDRTKIKQSVEVSLIHTVEILLKVHRACWFLYTKHRWYFKPCYLKVSESKKWIFSLIEIWYYL